MHSCSVRTGDNWLRSWVPKIIPKLGPHGVLIVLFDEGSTSRGCCGAGIGGGHIAVVIAGPGARHGVRIATPVDHYSILRLIEDAWSPRLAHAADATTHSIVGWRR